MTKKRIRQRPPAKPIRARHRPLEKDTSSATPTPRVPQRIDYSLTTDQHEDQKKKKFHLMHPLKTRMARKNLQYSLPNIPFGYGKSCAVVGNASSILESFQGNRIDSHDIIVRINTPKIKSTVSQGSRTTYLYVIPLTIKRLPRLQFPPYTVVNVSEHISDHLDKWTELLRSLMQDPKARPTTGFIAATHMVELGYKVNLYGFDWFDTESLSNQPKIDKEFVDGSIKKPQNAIFWKHHYPEWERAALTQILQDQSNSIITSRELYYNESIRNYFKE